MSPNFIHIGPGRSGTTFIYKVFEEHPEISLAKNTKETNYFTTNYNKGAGWYKGFFQEENVAIGEFGNTYIYDTEALVRINSDLPQVKVISILRNPYERLVSLLNYRRRSGVVDVKYGLVDLLKDQPTIEQNFYADQVSFLQNTFDKDRLFIGFYDDLIADAPQFLTKLFSFIGVDPDFRPQVLGTEVNASVAVKSPTLVKIGRWVADVLRKLELFKLLSHLKHSKVTQRLLFGGKVSKEAEVFDPKTITVLNLQISRLEQLTNRDLAHWKK